jgi:hypothetical protein
MKKLFISASCVFGVIPGIAVIKSGLGAPPGYDILFGGIIETLGALSILVLWLNKNRIIKIALHKKNKIVYILGILSFLFIINYLFIFNHCVIRDENRGTLYFPLWTSGELSEMIEKQGTRQNVIIKYGIDSVRDAINKMSDTALTFTTVILLFFYQLIFTSLTIVFGILGLYQNRKL